MKTRMRKRTSLSGVLITAVFLVNDVSADSVLRDEFKNVPMTNTTIFLFFVIAVIVVVLVLKYANKPTDVEKVSKKIKEEEEEREFMES
ncbi:MAG: hypothetical protein ABIG84_07055 [archaeon]